jgi:hypothetical protein
MRVASKNHHSVVNLRVSDSQKIDHIMIRYVSIPSL